MSAGEFESTMVPLEWIQNMNNPIPISMSGTGNLVFTLNASVTDPVCMFVGNDYFTLKETLSYTWSSGSNTVLNSSGATTTQTGSTLGVWYYYVGIVSGTVTIYPSQTAPSYVQHIRNAGFLGHPGTSRTEYWRYIGFQVCTTAATPVFLEMSKHAKTRMYTMPCVAFSQAGSDAANQNWTPSTPLYLPKHGVKLRGRITIGNEASAQVRLGFASGTPSETGPLDFYAKNAACVASIKRFAYGTFNNITANANGKVWIQKSTMTTVAAMKITGIEDVV